MLCNMKFHVLFFKINKSAMKIFDMLFLEDTIRAKIKYSTSYIGM